jgi:hypothetical protein
MITSHLKIDVEPTPKTSYISDIILTTYSVQYNDKYVPIVTPGGTSVRMSFGVRRVVKKD